MSFPAPAESLVTEHIDLNSLCVRHPAATYFMRMQSDLLEQQVRVGDVLVIDRAVPPRRNSLVVAVIDGDFVVQQMNPGATQHAVPQTSQEIVTSSVEIWGVVVSVIRTFR